MYMSHEESQKYVVRQEKIETAKNLIEESLKAQQRVLQELRNSCESPPKKPESLLEQLLSKALAKPDDSIAVAIKEVLQDIDRGITQGNAPNKHPNLNCWSVNIIPSTQRNICAKTLITYCYDEDDFGDRIRECLDYATLKCPGISEQIYFITTRWCSKEADLWYGYIEAVRKEGVEVNFIHLTRKGLSVMIANHLIGGQN